MQLTESREEITYQGMQLIVKPREEITWEKFTTEFPPYSIALDGFVLGGTNIYIPGPHLNLNHHNDCDRFITQSTCAQTKSMIKQHILCLYRIDNKLRGNIYVNDPDQDTSLSVWMLNHSDLFESKRTPPVLEELIQVEDNLDRFTGAYPYDLNAPRLKRSYWVFQPYTDARISGKLDYMGAEGMENIITEVGYRIDDLISGQGKMLEPDIRYNPVAEGKGWIMIEEIGPQARSYLFKQNKQLVITTRRINGRYKYALAKKVFYVDFSATKFTEHLNNLEGIPSDKWGGGNGIVASPRRILSSLTPDQFVKEMLQFKGPKFDQMLDIPPDEPETF